MGRPRALSTAPPLGAASPDSGRPRYTALGGPAVEARVHALVERVGSLVDAHAPPGACVALLLVGGYGRGEGGVERGLAGPRPHNNLDFLLVVRGLGARERRALGARLGELLEDLAAGAGLGLDLGVIAERALPGLARRVMGYDVRHGHRVVRGALPPALRAARLERIRPADVGALATNRAALLVFNAVLLDAGEPGPAARRAIVKHAAKATLGVGDALLFFRGAYHWSYREKGRRMAARRDVPAAFRALYAEALAFRFAPDHAAWASRDLRAHHAALVEALAPIHLAVERLRLGRPRLGWAGHAEAAFAGALREDVWSPRGWARKARAGSRGSPKAPAHLSRRARLGLRLTDPAQRLALLLPSVAYPAAARRDPLTAPAILGAPPGPALRRAYLRAWGAACDPSFAPAARRLGLDLDLHHDPTERGRA